MSKTSGTIDPTDQLTGTAVDFGDSANKALRVNVVAGGGGAGGGPATLADGADVAEGATTDLAVISDVNGSVSGKLRGLVKMFADMWDSANHWLQVKVMNTVTVTANAGANLNTADLALEAGGNLSKLALSQGVDGASTPGPMVQAVVNESVENYQTGQVQPLSLTTQGRLRVSSAPATNHLNFFDDDSLGGSNPSTDPFLFHAGPSATSVYAFPGA